MPRRVQSEDVEFGANAFRHSHIRQSRTGIQLGFVVEVEGQWRLFYHDTQLSNRTHLRSAKVVDLHHEADGSIRTIDPFISAP